MNGKLTSGFLTSVPRTLEYGAKIRKNPNIKLIPYSSVDGYLRFRRTCSNQPFHPKNGYSFFSETLVLMYKTIPHNKGPAIAQAVSRRLPTTAALVQTHVWSCGICDGQKWRWGR
jgi:hypothetical protein